MWFGDKEAGEKTGGPKVPQDGTLNSRIQPPNHGTKGEAKRLPLPVQWQCPQLAPSIRDWEEGEGGGEE